MYGHTGGRFLCAITVSRAHDLPYMLLLVIYRIRFLIYRIYGRSAKRVVGAIDPSPVGDEGLSL